MTSRAEGGDLTIFTNIKTKKLSVATINISETASGTLNFTGAFAINNIAVKWVDKGTHVEIDFSPILGVSSSAQALTSSNTLPASIRPLANRTFYVPGMVANAVEGIGFLTIRSTGVVTVNFNTINGVFTATGSCGFAQPQTFCYFI